MSELIDKRLVDEAVDAYVDWREERSSVRDAYARWTTAPVADSPLAFSAYGARWIERSAPRTCTPTS